jgi:hypothetical protein
MGPRSGQPTSFFPNPDVDSREFRYRNADGYANGYRHADTYGDTVIVA